MPIIKSTVTFSQLLESLKECFNKQIKSKDFCDNDIEILENIINKIKICLHKPNLQYLYKNVEDYEESIGYKKGNDFRLGWSTARLKFDRNDVHPDDCDDNE